MKGLQTIISTIIIELFCISDLSTITSNTKMKGAINEKEAKRLAKEQQEIERV